MRALSLVLMFASSIVAGQDQVASREKLASLVSDASAIRQTIQGWGTAVDPDGDCAFALQDGALVITVPGGHPPHDLSAEINSSNAPRVLREVKGDFTLQVCVLGEFKPGEKSTQAGRTGYTGAGLVLFADSKNYVRLERATLKRSANTPSKDYTNFEVRLHGQIQRFGLTSDLPLKDNQPVYLQLSRRGNTMFGAISQDGKVWKAAEPKKIEDWPATLLAGVAAISTSQFPFTPYFSDIRTSNNPKVDEEAKKTAPEEE